MRLYKCLCDQVHLRAGMQALLGILMTGRMMNGTESVIFILGVIIQSGFHPGLQPAVRLTLRDSLPHTLPQQPLTGGHTQNTVDLYSVYTCI